MSPNAMMAGKLTNRGLPDKVYVATPRKGGQKINLQSVDKKAAFALLVAQQTTMDRET